MASSRRNKAGLLLIAYFVLAFASSAHALPAFARKYGLRCSACHEAWPMLNYFGQKFKDNGYQLMNDRDAPIWQNPSYWPVTLRMTAFWHRESTDKVLIDTPAGNNTGVTQLTSTGFDLSGLDFHTAGTLDKNISFYLLPATDPTGAFHFEQVFGRLDNIFHSPWLNLKLGKFELDNLVSEKRILTLSTFGGFATYHFVPVGDGNIFGQLGDNQLGLEWLGHSLNDRTRISATLLSSVDGNVGLPYGKNAYSGFFTASQAFDVGKLGTDRVGFYAMVGQAPTTFLTSAGIAIPSSGTGNKGFSREGFVGLFYFGKLDFQVVTQHGSDSAWFGAGFGDLIDGVATGNNTPGTVLPAGARNPTWNSGFVETHWVQNPQLIFIQRSEWVRMSQQSIPGMPSNLGNLDRYVFAFRYMPFMTSRAGFAWHNEYSWNRQRGTGPPLTSGALTDLTGSSLMSGFDFDF